MFEAALTFTLRACLVPGWDTVALLAGLAGAWVLAIAAERMAGRA